MTVTAESIVWIHRLKRHGSTRLPTGERPRRLKKNRGCYVMIIALRNFDIVSRKNVARWPGRCQQQYKSRRMSRSTRKFQRSLRAVKLFQSLKSLWSTNEVRSCAASLAWSVRFRGHATTVTTTVRPDACKSPIRGLHSDFFVRLRNYPVQGITAVI